MIGEPALRLAVALWLGGIAAAGLAVVGAPWSMPVDIALLAHVTGLLAGYLVAVRWC